MAAASKTDPRRRALLAKVHLAKKDLALHEDSYRALLQRVTGTDSAGKCTDRQLADLLDEFRSLGWKPKRKAGKRRPQLSAHGYKALALWRSLYQLGEIPDASDRLLAGFVRRQTGKDALQWCGPEEISAVIEALKDRCERAGFAQPDDARVAAIRRWREGAALPPIDAGFAAKVNLIECLWRKLIDAGALDYGMHAHLGTWLRRRYGVAASHFLDEAEAQSAIDQLGAWWRRVKAKAAEGEA